MIKQKENKRGRDIRSVGKGQRGNGKKRVKKTGREM